MLISFKVKNFRSFKDCQSFTMTAGRFPNHQEENTFNANVEGLDKRLLRSLAFYGANASGKTNVLKALQFMQSFVLATPENLSQLQSQNQTFKFFEGTRQQPSEFEVSFVQDGVRYDYGFATSYARIEKEWLIQYKNSRGRHLFQREYHMSSGDYHWKFSPFFKGHKSLWSTVTRPDVLFLSAAIQLNSQQLLPVYEWFQKRLVIIFNSNFGFNTALTLNLLESPEGRNGLLSLMQDAGFDIHEIQLRREALPQNTVFLRDKMVEQRPGHPPSLVIITLKHPADHPDYAMLELEEESQGTQVFFRNLGAWMNVLQNGVVLFVDEIESSLHPLLIKFLIKKFHSNHYNPHNAQLIFTSHSSELMDLELFRRDQIWLARKDECGSSILYPLTKFKPRQDASLMRAYLRGAYGALPSIKDQT